LNSVKLRVEVSVICVYIIGNVCVTGNVWFIVDNILCSWHIELGYRYRPNVTAKN
jgi:hypothetical protein